MYRKSNTLYIQPFFLPENRAVCEIKWKNIVEPERPQIKIRRMRIACCIPKATGIHLEYVIFVAFTLQQLLHERASLLRYTCIACIVVSLKVQN
jgi:nitrogen regulatory protein PII-like uncharacterized protein